LLRELPFSIFSSVAHCDHSFRQRLVFYHSWILRLRSLDVQFLSLTSETLAKCPHDIPSIFSALFESQ
jgi:hypothetical protein